MAQTIYALASGAGRAGVAVIRLSGPEALATLKALSGDAPAAARMLRRVRLADPETGAALDDGMAVAFPGPHSYTGEDVVELHMHGGTAVLASILEALGRRPGLRLAEPGEFTRRAVFAGKMDLTAAEGLLDLIEAETDAQRRQALRQADGALGRLYDEWRAALVGALAHLEAEIDFPDEGLPDDLAASVRQELAALEDTMARHLDDDRRGERLRQGVRIAIVGPPNAGKSSLLNLLAQRDAAIVAATAGTTRDVIEVRLDLGGYPVLLGDTAGIRDAADEIEAEGVRRARKWAEEADLKIVVLAADGRRGDAPEGGDGAVADLIDGDTALVINKIDLRPPAEMPATPALGIFPLSVRTGQGVDAFLSALGAAVQQRIGLGDAPLVTRARHRDAVLECRAALARAAVAALPELAAEDLRLAVRALGRITGAVDVEELLDVIFRDFCIGK
ncbi:MAG: tRNA uridine-5-carboxymethylaminomethyl(34) synthesis GTPase MnmE [Alphaproteobacteria bacterium]|nr:tRNA uridine-5-carboxymethylaminomethyl(34) synthesis GTPase MnmE [Alphaproteobacteria bacterium]